MKNNWFYSTKGRVHGPCSEDELRQRVGAGLLEPDDPIWPAESDRGHSVPAGAAIPFPATPTSAPAAAPDWLMDVEEQRGPIEQDWPDLGIPDWINDLRLLDGQSPLAADADSLGDEATNPTVLDWLDPIAVPPELIPEGLAPTPPVHPPAPVSPLPEPAPAPPPGPAVVVQPEEHKAPIQPSPTPRQGSHNAPSGHPAPQPTTPPPSPPHGIPVVAPVQKQVTPQATPPATPPAVAPAAPSQTIPCGIPIAKRRPADVPAAAPRARAEDPVASPPAPASMREVRNESLQETYQRAQSALQQWADMELNRPLILSGDLAAVREDVAIQAILTLLAKFGQPIVDRFSKHLDFVLQNRRGYFQALERGK
jgi:hypothetical protein